MCVREVTEEIWNCWRKKQKKKSASVPSEGQLGREWKEQGREERRQGERRAGFLGRAHIPAEGADRPWITGIGGWAAGMLPCSSEQETGSERPLRSWGTAGNQSKDPTSPSAPKDATHWPPWGIASAETGGQGDRYFLARLHLPWPACPLVTCGMGGGNWL